MRLIIVSLVVLAIPSIAVYFLPMTGSVDGPMNSGPELSSFGQVDDFSFTDQTGAPYSSDGLEGKVWLANFVFTSCTVECPVLSERVAQVRHEFKDREDVAFISFSVDPQTDTPSRLTEYASSFGELDPRWRLLTGDAEALDTLIRQDLLLPTAADYHERMDITSSGFIHSNKILVVDRSGEIRYYSDGLQSDSVERLTKAINLALAE